MYKDTITLFNRAGKKNYTWYATVLEGVDLNIDKGSNIKTMGADAADAAMLSIKYTKSGEEISIGEKHYLLPKKWQEVADKNSALTFADGDDFFAVGNYGEGTYNDVDYMQDVNNNGFFDYMKQKHDLVFKITNVGFYNLIPHFEIGGA